LFDVLLTDFREIRVRNFMKIRLTL